MSRARAPLDECDDLNVLLERPTVAWPTVALFAAIVAAAAVATIGAASGDLPTALAMTVNTVCSYAAYSVMHEAAHGLVTQRRWLNEWVGRAAMAMVSLTPFFRVYRFLHITHHRFTNDPHRDPDISSGGGRWWTLPLRWAVMDVAYVCTYLGPHGYRARPRSERREFWLGVVSAVLVLAWVTTSGYWLEFALFYLVPTRIAIFVLAITFDFLPHYPMQHTAAQDPYKATSNRIGMEWLLSPLLIGQNYHLSHHLYPGAPFYRYRRVWEASQRVHDERMTAGRTDHRATVADVCPGIR